MKIIQLLLILISCIFISCENKKTEQPKNLSQMKDSGQLTAITLSSSVSYFIYKGEPMGYDYELLKSFADAHRLKFHIKLAENVTKLTEMLESGEGDLVAYHIPVTNEMKKKVIYCGKENINEQVLIQRISPKDTLLKDVTELIGKEIWVLSNSKHESRLNNLNEELGGGIHIKRIEKDTVSVEDLIEMVSTGKIRYTFCDKNIAQLNKTYYSNINISLKVSHPQRSSWAVGKKSPLLAQSLNQWFKDNKNTIRYQAIMKRYFEISKNPDEETSLIPVSTSTLSHRKISPYDVFFKKYAATINWDWRLLASISYQESKFDTTGLSWAGAAGLMGLMPKTAKAFGLAPEERENPEKNIKAATNYIKDLHRHFKSFENEEEKIKFILASYNAGIGHIFDAQALAKKLEKNPLLWENNVEECLKLKRLPEYYNDEVCKLGYFRGTETINYVKNVMKRWKYYQEKVKK